MSDATWEEEFYPIDASEWNGNAKDSLHNQIGATKHSLQKWKGLRKENLEKHKLEEAPISVSSSTCALCQLADIEDRGDCDTCPLFRCRGDVSCDNETENECHSPYRAYVDVSPSDPEPMIRELECTLEMLEKELKDEQSKYSSETK